MSAATLAGRVKAAREAAGLSMRAVAGVDHSLLSRLESGKITDPGIGTLTAIAKATGKTVDELMGAPASAVRMLPLCDIEADPENPRRVDVANTVDADFVDSIRTQGLLQAVTVRRMPADHDGAPWRIAFGGRRYAALSMIHGPKSKQPVPVLVLHGDDAADLLLKQLVENIARADMNPADLAQAIATLVDKDQDTAAIATALKRGRRWVQEQASVGRYLTPGNIESLRKGALNISQAVAIAAERDPTRQDKLGAHASLQSLTEDEIRAIIADGKAKEATAKAEAEAVQQPALIPTPKTWPTPNEHGVFDKEDVSELRNWSKAKRGHLQVSVLQFDEHKFASGFAWQWRTAGGGSPLSATQGVQKTAAIALLDAVRRPFESMRKAAEGHPEDIIPLRELHVVITTWLRNLRATDRVMQDWEKNHPAPELPKAKPAPAPTPSSNNRKVKMLPAVDITKAPTWAAPMVDALFMYHTGRTAFLCKGWVHMAKTFAEHLDADQEELRALYDRAAWANDLDGKPFDFGGAVVRLVDAPA